MSCKKILRSEKGIIKKSVQHYFDLRSINIQYSTQLLNEYSTHMYFSGQNSAQYCTFQINWKEINANIYKSKRKKKRCLRLFCTNMRMLNKNASYFIRLLFRLTSKGHNKSITALILEINHENVWQMLAAANGECAILILLIVPPRPPQFLIGHSAHVELI